MPSAARSRLDLTNWILHFVHPYRSEYVPDDLPDGRFLSQIHHEDGNVNERFDLWEMFEQERQLYDFTPFAVLQRIVEMGFIRTSWSWRNERATIYGPRAASCFTEMPLYALVDYSKNRAKSQSVSPYCIGIRRREFFLAGGRPVIYGLSGPHKEIGSSQWPRKLNPECGISEKEQYRYVAMVHGEREIDWSHEREWRWADIDDRFDCPGLPIWLKNDHHKFSKVFIVLETVEEAEIILKQLKEQFDAGSHDYDWEYERSVLKTTLVTSMEEIRGRLNTIDLATLKFEDIPFEAIKVMRSVEPSAATIQRAHDSITLAQEAANRAAATYRASAPRNDDGYIKDVFGFAHVICTKEFAYREEIAALVAIGEADPIGGRGYYVGNFAIKASREGVLAEQEAAARAAVEVLNKELGDFFEVRIRWD